LLILLNFVSIICLSRWEGFSYSNLGNKFIILLFKSMLSSNMLKVVGYEMIFYIFFLFLFLKTPFFYFFLLVFNGKELEFTILRNSFIS